MLEIGSLIGISKTFLETFGLLKKLVGDSGSAESKKVLTEMHERINQLKNY